MFEYLMIGFAACAVAMMIGSLSYAIRLVKQTEKELDATRKCAKVYA